MLKITSKILYDVLHDISNLPSLKKCYAPFTDRFYYRSSFNQYFKTALGPYIVPKNVMENIQPISSLPEILTLTLLKNF